MRSLLKVMLLLAAIFASTFVAGRLLGILTTDNVTAWLEAVQNAHPGWVGALVILLLFADLFVAMPTLTITILAGFFLGFPFGFLAALAGMSSAAFCGYLVGAVFGDSAIGYLVSDVEERSELERSFRTSGPAMIMLSRAIPIMPEVTACMAGATRLGFGRYVLFFMLSTVPYVTIATFAGSTSSLENPQPAILAVIFLYAVLWAGWYVYNRTRSRA